MANDRSEDTSGLKKSESQGTLDPQTRDHLSRLARAVTGGVPFVGPAIAEIIDSVIPNQRIDRIAAAVARLEQTLPDELTGPELHRLLETPEAVDLLEDGLSQAARALTDERIERIASLLKNSLTSEDIEHIEKKTLFELLGRVNDAELIILHSYGFHSQLRRDFFERHADVLYGVRAHLGSSQEDIDRAAIHGTHRRKLRELGLITPRFQRPKRGELPELDTKTGMVKARGDKLTPLGRLLLRYLDMEVEC